MLRKIWRIRVYESIFKFFSDLIPTWWIIKIVFYKNFCHIIIHKIFASLMVLNSSFFSFFLFVTNPIDRTTCKNVIEKTNAKVIVCLNLKFFCRYKKVERKEIFRIKPGKRMIGIIWKTIQVKILKKIEWNQ